MDPETTNRISNRIVDLESDYRILEKLVEQNETEIYYLKDEIRNLQNEIRKLEPF